MRALFLSLLLLGAATALAGEASYLEEEVVQPAAFGRPEQRHLQRTWMVPGLLRRDDERARTSTLVSLENGRITMVNHEDRTWFAIDRAEIKRLGELGAALLAEGGERELVATGEERRVGPWTCEVYSVDDLPLPGGRVSMCVSDDVPISEQLRRQFVDADIGVNAPGFQRLSSQIRELGGYPVETEIRLEFGGSSITTFTRLIQVKTIDVESEHFEVPADYRQIDNPLAAMGLDHSGGAE